MTASAATVSLIFAANRSAVIGGSVEATIANPVIANNIALNTGTGALTVGGITASPERHPFRAGSLTSIPTPRLAISSSR